MRVLSLSQLTLDPVSGPDLVSAAAAAGFDAVTMRLKAPPGFELASPGAGAPVPVAEIKRRLAATGLEILDATSLWLAADAQPRDFVPALDAAAELGAGRFTVVVTDAGRSRALANFAATCALAGARGLRIALEFMPYSALRTLGEAARFLEDAHQPNAGILLDALHLSRSGGSPADLNGVETRKILFVQLCDAPLKPPPREALRAESRTRRLYPGQGELPLRALLDALPPDLPIDVEAPCAADAALTPGEKAVRAAEFTRKFLAG